MNQEKIGKLIAKMRKQKDLTQCELGEMVGVGFRAVSKWERGLTMPDISIINELSTILGISSDELLNGELMPKDDNKGISTSDKDSKPLKKNNKKLLFLLIILILIIIAIVGMIIIRNNNQNPSEYIIKSLNPDEYQVDGLLIADGSNLIVKIDKIEFEDYTLSQMIIKNYEFKLLINDIIIFGIGSTDEYSAVEDNVSVKELAKNFKIDYKEPNNIRSSEINKLSMYFRFTEIDDNVITKDIESKLEKQS